MLMSAVFAQSDCSETNWEEYYNNKNGRIMPDMRDCDLEGALLEGANLKSALLSGANLEGANLEGANLNGSSIARANLEGAILKGATISSSNAERANLTNANLEGAYLQRARFIGANLTGALLSGADLRAANLSGANLEGALLEGALLELVTSERLKGKPASLPKGWSLVDGTLIEDRELKELSDELFKTISSNGGIKKSEWRAWKKENKPQVSRGNTHFKTVDKNNNNKIGKGEFLKFYKRLIKEKD